MFGDAKCNDSHSLFSFSIPIRFVSRILEYFAGTLTINGNPRLDNNGNISLSIRERDAPISIAPGTKNLVLNAALDREGKTGPSSVYVNVICVRRHITDPAVSPVSSIHASCAIIML